MPTYLVAFVISNFQGQRSPNTMHGIYTPPHLVSQTTYGLQFAEQVFEKLDEFTNLPIFSVPDVEKMVSFLIWSSHIQKKISFHRTMLLFQTFLQGEWKILG
jgi:hypothetical protein